MSMRDMMFQSAVSDMAKGFDKDMETLSKLSKMEPMIFAKTNKPLSICNCYLCGTHDNIEEIVYGDARYGNSNCIRVCPECRKWLGEFLLSEAKEKRK